MSSLPDISIRLHGDIPARECVRRAIIAERSGFHAAWFAENAFSRGILPAAAVCATATERLNFRVGVFNPTSRHPTMMAMEIGALDELSNHRVGISIGAGIGSAVSKIGGDARAPLTGIKDTVKILRGMFSGEVINYDGKAYCAKGVQLEFETRRDIPIFIAARGEKTLLFCGEAADGLIVSNMCSLGYAAKSAELVRNAEEKVLGTRKSHIVRYLPGCVAADGRLARNGAKHMLKELVPNFWKLSQKVDSARMALLLETGISEGEFQAASDRLLDGQAPETALSDRFVSAFAIAGTPDECAEQAFEHKTKGISELAITFDSVTTDEAQISFGRAL